MQPAGHVCINTHGDWIHIVHGGWIHTVHGGWIQTAHALQSPPLSSAPGCDRNDQQQSEVRFRGEDG